MPPPPRLSSYFEDEDDQPRAARGSKRTTALSVGADSLLVGRIGGKSKKGKGRIAADEDSASATTTRPASSASSRSDRSERSAVHSGDIAEYNGLSKKKLREHYATTREAIQDEHKITRSEILENTDWKTYKAFKEVNDIKRQIYEEQKASHKAFFEKHKAALLEAREAAKAKKPHVRSSGVESWHLRRVRYMHEQYTVCGDLPDVQEMVMEALEKTAHEGSEEKFQNPMPPLHEDKGYFTYNLLHWCFRAISHLVEATEKAIERLPSGNQSPAQKKFLIASRKADLNTRKIRDIRKRLNTNRKERPDLEPPLVDAFERKHRGDWGKETYRHRDEADDE